MTEYKLTSAPKSEQELLERSAQLAGKTLDQLAKFIGINVPENQKRAKGWIGVAVEIYLGATASSKPEPDFQYIGVELKTLPVNRNGRPKESTYVCTVPLTGLNGLTWELSTVKKKLSRVLWAPIEADPQIPFAQRRFGSAFLWSPDKIQEMDLRNDWQEIIELIGLGELNQINSQYGTVMQIRPKGMDSRALTKTETETGETGHTLPRGFYLRSSFTNSILKQNQTG